MEMVPLQEVEETLNAWKKKKKKEEKRKCIFTPLICTKTLVFRGKKQGDKLILTAYANIASLINSNMLGRI